MRFAPANAIIAATNGDVDMRWRVLCLAGVLAAVGFPAFAASDVVVVCADWQRQPDGTWKRLRGTPIVQRNGVTIQSYTGEAFRGALQIGTHDLVDVLNEQCGGK